MQRNTRAWPKYPNFLKFIIPETGNDAVIMLKPQSYPTKSSLEVHNGDSSFTLEMTTSGN